MKRVRAGFTVEAALVVPFVTFIIAGIIYIIAYAHDRTLLHTYVYRTAEDQLSQEYSGRYGGTVSASSETAADAGKSIKKSLIMMKSGSFSISGDKMSFRSLYHSMKSYKSETASGSGNIGISDAWVTPFTGSVLQASESASAVTVNYADDWLRKKYSEKDIK